jgi:C1A family cysteine protease
MKLVRVTVGFGLLAALFAASSSSAVAGDTPVIRMRVKSLTKMGGPSSLTQRFAHLPPVLPPSTDAVNIQKLQSKAANSKACGISEVAPGVFVRLDCHQYTRVSKSAAHLSPAKLRMLKQGGLSVRGLTVIKSMKIGRKVHIKGVTPAPTPTGTADIKASGPISDSGGGSASESFPDAVDHRALGLSGPVKNQGAVGACTAFALSTAVDNALRRAGREETISPSHVWSGYGMPNMQDAGDSNLNRDLATFDTWPYSQKEGCRLARHPGEECQEYVGVPTNSWKSDPKLMASLTKANAAGVTKISSMEELAVGPANIDEMVQVLASGSDIWSAIRIDGSSWSSRAMKNGVIPDWAYPNGGHAVTISGYRDTPKGKQFMIHNSWGDSWGDKGYAWISEAMVKQHLKFAYRVKLDGESNKPIELTDDDCAYDELVDAVTGKCGKICADDSRPADGQCEEATESVQSPKKK